MARFGTNQRVEQYSASASATSTVLEIVTAEYSALGVQLSGTWVGTVAFEVSNDATTWTAVYGVPGGAASTPVASMTANGLISIPTVYRYWRAVFTRTSGTVTVAVVLRDGAGDAGSTSGSDAAIGSVGDAAWSSGDGTAIALLKTIASSALATDPVAVTLASGATAIAKAEDVASADGDVGVPAMAIRKATPANISGTDGDYEMLQISGGRLWTDAGALVAPMATTTARLLSSAATTNDTNVKGSAGTLRGIQGHNARTSAVYLKLYNKATAPTVGTDTPVKTIYLPASTSFALDFQYSFSTGLGYGLTTAGADNSTAAVASGDILALNIDYV